MAVDHIRVFAAAYVRGSLRARGETTEETDCPLEHLTDAQIGRLIGTGKQLGLKMYRFKEKEDLPRVKKVLGFLKGVYPETLLDVGSGRGVFLFPFLREFPRTEVTSLDIKRRRVDFLNTVRSGGVERLRALREDICTWDAPSGSFDTVTLLEVLEHIPDVERAVKNAVRLAKRYIVVSVPSKPDNNPEHIHLLTKDKLTTLFTAAGVKKLHFDGVNGHLLMTATKE